MAVGVVWDGVSVWLGDERSARELTVFCLGMSKALTFCGVLRGVG